MATISSWFVAVGAFEAAHWQGQAALIATQIPSIIVALTNYPKAQNFLSTLLKVLNFMSVLSHKDSPGTLKAPFTQSLPPTVIGSPVVPKGFVKTGMGLLLAAGAALGIACASCAHVTPLEQSLLNCGEAALAQVATSAGPQVLVILQGGSPNWAAQLTSLVGSLGNGVICAVNAIVASLQAKAPADLAPVDQLTIVRAQAWLDLQSVKVAPVAAERH